jgi:hypothetical protein
LAFFARAAVPEHVPDGEQNFRTVARGGDSGEHAGTTVDDPAHRQRA